MRFKSIAAHLKPYRMVASRRTTINHMFAAAVAPYGVYNEAEVRAAVTLLGNDPERDLRCAYCWEPAETWDHIFATVRDSQFSGHGHQLGNLLPCCKYCNSRKGNKHWEKYLGSLPLSEGDRSTRKNYIASYITAFRYIDGDQVATEDHRRLDELRSQILKLMAEADLIAERIRSITPSS